MKKIIFVLFLLFISLSFGFTNESTIATDQSSETSTDPFAFVKSSVKIGYANIDFAFNEMTGVLRVTYTIKDHPFDRGDANTTIRDAVDKFARDNGYFKARLYTDEDDCAFFAQKNTYRYKRFYILHDKSRL
ncbi:MAG: hypothetical protein GX220_06085 [Treponema sp.]|nr:hypothetical protein [Treponema sp.]